MAWVATAVTAASTIYSATQKDKGGSVEFKKVPESEQAKKARQRLFDISEQEPPAVPLRGVAPLEPLGPEREAARETALELIQPQDFFALPEVQGIISEARESGNLLTNRLGRMLQASGNITSTTGRDVLGRAVTDVQKRLAASLAPFAAEERLRRERLIPELERLGLTEELRKQGFTQAQLDALFQKETLESRQLQDFTIPLLQSIISLQPDIQPIIRGEGQSTLSQLAPLIGDTLTAILNRGNSNIPTGTPVFEGGTTIFK
jgi:hypothetical protein